MKYVVKAAYDDSKWIAESIKGKNSRIVGKLPEGEDPEWMQLEMVDQGDGMMVETLTVDEVKKAQVLEQRLADQMAKEAEAESKAQAKEAKKQKVKGIKKNKINNLTDIKDALVDIKQWVLEAEGEDDEQ